MNEWLKEQLDIYRSLNKWADTANEIGQFFEWIQERGAAPSPWHPISDLPPEGASVLLLDAKTPWADIDWEYHESGLDPNTTHWQVLELPQEAGA